jgi:beta-lactamase regulating signal transducer with metallopeptidase domain
MSIALSLPPVAAFAAAVTAKATLVLLAAAAAAGVVALRGGSAAARHLAWTLGVCGVLALPLFSATLPGWRTPLLPIPTARAAAPATFAAAPVLARPVSAIPGAVTRTSNPARVAANPILGPSHGATARNGGGLGMAIVALYLLGVLAVLGRLAIGRWSVARLAARAEVVDDAAWTGLLRDVGWELGIGRAVRLLRGGGATMPMTWGIAHPAVLLPAEAAEWPEARRRVVLMHELAHVARHDCLTQTLAAAACALYWFHPAAWYAARRLRVERELACDDRVLQAGTRARDYALHLLEVARAFRPARLAGTVAVSMARPSQLEGRLLAVLDGVRDRRMPGRAAASAAAALALALVLPLAAIRPGNAQRAVPEGVTFGGPKPWKDTVKVKPPRSSDAYPDQQALDAAMRQGGTDIAIPARPGERLTLTLPRGVSARVEAWDRPSVHVRVDDPGLQVRAERGEGGPHVTVTGQARTDRRTPDVRIQAPRDFDVHTQTNGGGVEIGALHGTFTGSVAGGGVAFVGTSGTVRMTARGGGAYVSHAHLDGRLEMDGGGALVDGNSGNLDITGGAATAHGRPGGNLRIDVPSAARAGSDDDEVACAGDACTITGRGSASRTTVSTSQGGGGQVVATTVSGHAVAVGAAPARATTVVTGSGQHAVAVRAGGSGEATTVTVGGQASEPVYVVDGVVVASGEGGSRASTVTAAVGGSATTITAESGATTRDRDGFAYTTGDVPGRIAAIRQMARSAPPAAAASGIGRLAFSEEDERVQRAAVEELARLGTRAADEQLRRIAREHPRSSIRARAAAALR